MNFQIKEAFLIFQLFNMLSLNMKNKINSICLSTKKKTTTKTILYHMFIHTFFFIGLLEHIP